MRATGVKYLAQAGGAELLGLKDSVVLDVKIDSREIYDGCMFLSVIGETFDGHNYMQAAYDNGARVFLASERDAAFGMLQKHDDITVLLCDDVTACFEKMAESYLNQFPGIRKLAVTGSVGKTTTKNLVAAVMAAKYATVSSDKNFNTHLGLSLTAFKADEKTEAIVFEMGADRKGEISDYCDWVKPNTGIVTNVGICHLEFFETRDNIALEKLSITKHLKDTEYLVYECDGDYLDSEESVRRFSAGENFRSMRVGTKGDVRFSDVRDLAVDGIDFDVTYEGKTVAMHLPMAGAHNAINASLAVGAGLIYGVSLEEARDALSKVSGIYRRLETSVCGGITIIDDTYNANPTAMRGALDFLSHVKAERKVAVLGIMRELGSEYEQSHLDMGREVAKHGIDVLVTVADKDHLYEVYAKENPKVQIFNFENRSLAQPFLFDFLKPGDAVLIKGSLVTYVGDIAKALKEHFSTEAKQ